MPNRYGTKYLLRIRSNGPIVPSSMKNLLTLTVTALALAAFASTTFAEGGCGGSSDDGDKKKDKTEEGCAS